MTRGKLTWSLAAGFLVLAGCSSTDSNQDPNASASLLSGSSESTLTAEPLPETKEPKPVARPQWDELNSAPTREMAFEESIAYLRGVTPVADPINHIFSPNADKSVAQRTLEKMPEIAGLFAEVATPSNFSVVWMDDADAAGASEFVCQEIGRCDIEPTRDVCSMGVVPGIVFFCYSAGADPGRLVSVMSHDYAHFVQYDVSGSYSMPNWFAEGTATYFEKILEAKRFSYGVDTLDNGLVWGVDILYESPSPLAFGNPPTEDEVIRAMESSIVFGDLSFEQASLGYYLGTLTTEVMIAKEGLVKFFEFWRLTGEMEFGDAFVQVYELSMSEFFEYFAPYAVEKIVSDGKR